MANELEPVKAHAMVPMGDMERMANAIARSGFFGVKNVDQAMALMFVAQAEGRHPATVAQDYHIIQGKPSLKADAALSRYQQSGGRVEWHDMSDVKVSATFTHPQSGSVKIEWTIEMAENAGLFIVKDGKRGQMTNNGFVLGNYHKYPRQMLRARVISEGVRTSFPGVLGGMYTPEEVGSFDSKEVDVVEHDQKVQEAMVKVRENLIESLRPVGVFMPIEYAELLSEAKTTADLAGIEIKAKEKRTDARKMLNAKVKEYMAQLGWDKAELEKYTATIINGATDWVKLSLEDALEIYTQIQKQVEETK